MKSPKTKKRKAYSEAPQLEQMRDQLKFACMVQALKDAQAKSALKN